MMLTPFLSGIYSREIQAHPNPWRRIRSRDCMANSPAQVNVFFQDAKARAKLGQLT